MYLAARSDPNLSVLSWQGTGGKGYFTKSVRFHVHGSVQLPDLVLRSSHGYVWVFELKGSHPESLRDDEPKLLRLADAFPGDALKLVVAAQCGLSPSTVNEVTLAVAYTDGQRTDQCASGIAHLPWMDVSREIRAGASLSAALARGLG